MIDEEDNLTDDEFIESVGNALNIVIEAGLQTTAWALGDCQTRLLKMRVERFKTLVQKREQYRHPKDKEYTDFDRKTMLEAQVADVQADYELVKGLEDLVMERVELIKILLKG